MLSFSINTFIETRSLMCAADSAGDGDENMAQRLRVAPEAGGNDMQAAQVAPPLGCCACLCVKGRHIPAQPSSRWHLLEQKQCLFAAHADAGLMWQAVICSNELGWYNIARQCTTVASLWVQADSRTALHWNGASWVAAAATTAAAAAAQPTGAALGPPSAAAAGSDGGSGGGSGGGEQQLQQPRKRRQQPDKAAAATPVEPYQVLMSD